VPSSFTWDLSKFESPKKMELKLQRALYGVVKYWDGRVETYIKHNAPWKDRTTNARNGLFAVAKKSAARIAASTFAIVLGHTVDYGIYLEAGHDQETKDGVVHVEARPIIWPAILLYAPKVMKTLKKILDRMG
jgi:hypothetical protein